MLHKKRAAAFAAVAVVLAAVLVYRTAHKPMLHGDYPYYPDVESITQASDLILVGEVLQSGDVQALVTGRTSGGSDREAVPYTVSTVRVIEAVKGDVQAEDLLEVKQLGDYQRQPEETLHQIDGYLKQGQTMLLFLTSYAESPCSLVTPAQGMAEVLEGDILYSASRYALFGYQDGSGQSADTLGAAVAEIGQYLRG